MTIHEDALSRIKQAPALMRRIAFARFDFDVMSSGDIHRIAVAPGEIAFRPSGGRPPDFTIKAGAQAWSEFARPAPRPGFNDVVALIESGHAEITGDTLLFFRHLFFVKGVIEALFRGDHGFALSH